MTARTDAVSDAASAPTGAAPAVAAARSSPTRRARCLGGAAVALLLVGIWLAHRVEPGVTVEHVMVAGQTPALHVYPAAPPQAGRPYPVAVLGHGVTASKETLFCLSEALAAKGFDCYAIDFPGHGESPRAFMRDDNVQTLKEVAAAVGPVRVYVGHSMGAYAGAAWDRQSDQHPAAFIALGALPQVADGTPLLLLAGQFEEAISLAALAALEPPNGFISPLSDHALEPYDPLLVSSTVNAATGANGPPLTRWAWRLLGLFLAGISALLLAYEMTALVPTFVRGRGLAIALLAIGTVALAAGTWVGAAPVPRRLPLQLAFAAVLFLVLWLAGKLRIPRWSYAALGGLVTLGCLLVGQPFLALFAGLLTAVLAGGTVLGWLATRRGGLRSEGDLAYALLVAYALGQWLPLMW